MRNFVVTVSIVILMPLVSACSTPAPNAPVEFASDVPATAQSATMLAPRAEDSGISVPEYPLPTLTAIVVPPPASTPTSVPEDPMYNSTPTLVPRVTRSSTVATDTSQSAPAVTPTQVPVFAIVDVASLGARSGPGMSFPIVTQVHTGIRYRVIGKSDSEIWFELDTDTGAVWVALRYLILEGDIAHMAVTAQDPSPNEILRRTPLPRATNTPFAPSPEQPSPPAATETPIAPPAAAPPPPSITDTPIAPAPPLPSPTPTDPS